MTGARTPLHGRNHILGSADPIVIWRDFPLDPPWTNVGDPYHNAQYGRGPHGLVFRGQVTGGSAGDSFGTLPSNDWPDKDEHYAIVRDTQVIPVLVSSTNGSVTPLA